MNIEDIQRRLWIESQAQPVNWYGNGEGLSPGKGNRARNLMDLLHSPEWLKEAAERTLKKSKNKATGIDRMTVKQYRENYDANLADLRDRLKRGIYRPQPARRVEINKANGKKRPLGIPCLEDKIVQEAMRMILEPIFEPEFHDESYGFRKGRNIHHAIHRCCESIRQGYDVIIEGDISKCFDRIDHHAICKALRRKIQDKKFIELIRRFLAAGVQIGGVTEDTVEGTPQGGIISPLLANIVLNMLDWFLHEKGQGERKWKIEFVRYADDWCVFMKNATVEEAEELKEEIATFLRKETGLELSVEKTLITSAGKGIDFLGRRITHRGGGKVVVEITEEKFEKLCERIDDAMEDLEPGEWPKEGIERMNRMLDGWAGDLRHADNYPAIAEKLDRYIRERVEGLAGRPYRQSGIEHQRCRGMNWRLDAGAGNGNEENRSEGDRDTGPDSHQSRRGKDRHRRCRNRIGRCGAGKPGERRDPDGSVMEQVEELDHGPFRRGTIRPEGPGGKWAGGDHGSKGIEGLVKLSDYKMIRTIPEPKPYRPGGRPTGHVVKPVPMIMSVDDRQNQERGNRSTCDYSRAEAPCRHPSR